jgi:hypothetical protein
MDAPNAFSSELEKWIYNRSIRSIFFVNIVAKDINQIEQRMNEVGTIEAEERGKELELDLDGQGRCCTGFVVEEKANHLTILTCAHLLQHVFKGSDPISVKLASELFDVYVLCDHYELSFRHPRQGTHETRVYTRASIIAISCRKDLLLLRVVRSKLMDLDSLCVNNHRALTISPTPPETFDKCAMISWPPLRPRTAVGGAISSPSRSFLEIEENNPAEYTMNFIQADIASEKGSSGAPLLDGNGRVIGLLHGVSINNMQGIEALSVALVHLSFLFTCSGGTQ